jgi:hypothetical protein
MIDTIFEVFFAVFCSFLRFGAKNLSTGAVFWRVGPWRWRVNKSMKVVGWTGVRAVLRVRKKVVEL